MNIKLILSVQYLYQYILIKYSTLINVTKRLYHNIMLRNMTGGPEALKELAVLVGSAAQGLMKKGELVGE